MDINITEAIGIPQIAGVHFLELLLRLLSAALLGSALAWRPWRRFMRAAPALRVETAHAQILICVAAAMVVAVIGDNVARAFGLVGLGGFIRFRSGIKDPRDAAIMFVMIGVGMACGLGVVPVALVSTVFVSAVLAVFDTASDRRPRLLKVGIVAEDAIALVPFVQKAWPASRILTIPNVNDRAKLVFEMDVSERVDASTILATLQQAGSPAMREVWISDD